MTGTSDADDRAQIIRVGASALDSNGTGSPANQSAAGISGVRHG
jgi:hypothetical protein